MKLTGKLTKESRSLNAALSPRAGGGRVKDVTYNDESVVNNEGVAVIPPYPTIPVKNVTYNGDSVVNENGVAVIPVVNIPVRNVVDINNNSLVNQNGVAVIPIEQPKNKTLVYTLPYGAQWFNFTNPNADTSKKMLLRVEMPLYDFNEEFEFTPNQLPNRESGDNYTTIGAILVNNIPINLGQKYNGGDLWISTNGTYDTNNISVRVYNID